METVMVARRAQVNNGMPYVTSIEVTNLGDDVWHVKQFTNGRQTCHWRAHNAFILERRLHLNGFDVTRSATLAGTQASQ